MEEEERVGGKENIKDDNQKNNNPLWEKLVKRWN